MRKLILLISFFTITFYNGYGQTMDSNQVEVWVLDSIHNYGLDGILGLSNSKKNKYEKFKYDNNGRVIEYIYGRRLITQGDTSFRNSEKYIYGFTSNGLMELKEQHLWNTAQNKWRQKSKSEFTYDSNENIIKVLSFAEGTNSQWKLIGEWINVYDVNDSIVETVRWSDRQNGIIDYTKELYQYSNDGELVFAQFFEKGGLQHITNWKPLARINYFFYPDGKDSCYVHEDYSNSYFDTVLSRYKYYNQANQLVKRTILQKKFAFKYGNKL